MRTTILSRWPLFCVLYPLNSVLLFYITYYHESSPKSLIITLGFTGIFISLFWLIHFVYFHDLNKSAVMVFVSSIFFFSFQQIVSQLGKVSIIFFKRSNSIFWFCNLGQFIVLCSIVLFIAFVFYIVSKVNKINSITIKYLNIFTIILLILTIIPGQKLIKTKNDEMERFILYWQDVIDGFDVSSSDSHFARPDIYYIILDGFARSDVLLDLYDLDNSKFINALGDRGFFVASESYANYTQTRTSLASSLNMMYLDEASDIIGEDKLFYLPTYHMIDNSIVEHIFRSYGYEMVSFRSGVSFTEFSDWENYYYLKLHPDTYSQTFFSTTAMSVFINPKLYQWHFNNVNFILETLPVVSNHDDAQFIFAHIMCPHPPFVFNIDGTLRKSDRLFSYHDGNFLLSIRTKEEYLTGYPNQVMFLQDAILEMVDEIINTSTDPFILILQSDHGSGMNFDNDYFENTNIIERLGILNAIYFYDQDYEHLYPQISPVNTFRIIFSQYFGIDQPLLVDKHYYTGYLDLFNFVPVDNYLK